MPRNVRNFWLDARIDGRNTIGTGPQGQDGGVDVSFKIRNHGDVEEAFTVTGRADRDGNLTYVVRFNDTGETVKYCAKR